MSMRKTDGQILMRYYFFEQKEQFEVSVDESIYWRAFAIEDGHFKYNIGDKKGDANTGQLVICPPNIPFNRHTQQPITFHFFIFQWKENTDDTQPIEVDLSQVILTYRNQYRFFSSLSLLANSAQLIKNEQARRWQNHLFCDLILLYASEQIELPLMNHVEQIDPLMAKTRSLIERHFKEPVSIQEIAERIGLSPVQLSRRFRKSFGLNPSEYLRKLRIDQATQLLTKTNLSIENIALQCGYSSGFYFSRIFSEMMNISPSRFREIHKV